MSTSNNCQYVNKSERDVDADIDANFVVWELDQRIRCIRSVEHGELWDKQLYEWMAHRYGWPIYCDNIYTNLAGISDGLPTLQYINNSNCSLAEFQTLIETHRPVSFMWNSLHNKLILRMQHIPEYRAFFVNWVRYFRILNQEIASRPDLDYRYVDIWNWISFFSRVKK